jgi:putative ABC transport system permease protein
MLRNYLKIAIRSLWRHKAFTAINIFGLALGLACCLLILLFVRHELSYDRFHEKADRMVRVEFRGSVQGQKMNEAHVMPPVAQTLLAEYPEVEEATRLRPYGTPKIRKDEALFRNLSFAFADSNFFQVFSLPLLQGDPLSALSQPHTLVISQAAARSLFGEQNPLGRQLQFPDWQQAFTVTGIMADMPENSHFQFELLGSMASFPEARSTSWMVSEFYTYLVLAPGYDHKQLEDKLPQLAEKYMSPQLQQAMGISLAQFKEAGNSIGLYLQPLTDIYLHSEASGALKAGGNVQYVYIFSAIALFMLLIACINFMNLSTAGASKRAREVGVRKVLGSGQRQLVVQFLLESMLLSLLALLLALVLVHLAQPLFTQLSGKGLDLSLTAQPWLLPALLLLTVVVGVLAGSYPAFFLSSFKPVAVLKGGKFSGAAGDRSGGIRSGLVVVQFMISIGLIIGTLVVYQQLQYIQNKEVGYTRDQVLVLHESQALGGKLQAFQQQLLQDPRVLSVSTSGYLPAGPSFNNNFFLYPQEDVSQQVKTLRYDVDEQYIPTLGMQLLAGRNFSAQRGGDATAMVLNETAARALGLGEEALGVTLTTANNEGVRTSYQVIGIVADFHFRSLHERISPLVMVQGESPSGSVIVKAQTDDMPGLLASLAAQWTSFAPEEPFSYSFLDERYAQAYQAEQKLGLMLGLFAGLTIFVACLGLFGLALFTAERRTKEIGIRKVLGASEGSLVLLLSRDFIKLLLIAFLIASPIAGYFMHHWLQDFAYRIELSGWVFAGAGLLALFIALATVSVQALKAALANPVKNLRTE